MLIRELLLRNKKTDSLAFNFRAFVYFKECPDLVIQNP
jgi:hypothetical protein